MLEIEKKVLQFLYHRNNEHRSHASFIDRKFPELRIEFSDSEGDRNMPYKYDPQRDKLGQLLIRLENLGYVTFGDGAFVTLTDLGKGFVEDLTFTQE